MTLFEAYVFHIAGLLNGMVFGGYLTYRILTRKAVARSAREAAKLINDQEDGPYKDALITYAKQANMVEDAKKKGRVKACRRPK